MEVGDLVKLKSFLINGKNLHEDLVGIIVDKGTERRRMYGDGVEICDYVDVKWLGDNTKYKNIARYSPAQSCLEVISEA
mgnify:FL=1|tara:strand:- start:438 stop:674 length:237 start_codon:yes stop_codon:yes gene_type:complete